jgi:hypothetical protein
MSDMAISRQLTGLHPPTEYVSNSSGLQLEGHVLQRALTRNRHFAKDAKSGAPPALVMLARSRAWPARSFRGWEVKTPALSHKTRQGLIG